MHLVKLFMYIFLSVKLNRIITIHLFVYNRHINFNLRNCEDTKSIVHVIEACVMQTNKVLLG